MTYLSDLEHAKLTATVFPDAVEEEHYISDPIRGIKKKLVKKKWHVERILGEVHLVK